MRIVFCVDKLSGGAGNVAQQLACHFSQDPDNKVTVTIIGDNGTNPKYDFSKVNLIDRHLDCAHISNPFSSVRRYFNLLKSTRSLIKSCNPDVVVSFLNSISPEILLSLIGTGIPVIVSERSNPYQEWKDNRASFNVKWAFSYLLAKRIVYQFDYFRKFLKIPYALGKTVTIPNMVMSYSEVPHTTSDKIRFCTFASLFPVKRQELMFSFFEKVHRKYPYTELNVYGNGSLFDSLKLMADKIGGINMKGAVPNSADEHCNNDIFLLTSEREGFPNAMLEAMASGLPVIALRCHDGLAELVDGTNGFLVDDEDSYLAAMEQFVRIPNLIVEMGESARISAKKYSYENVLPKWESTIKGAL